MTTQEFIEQAESNEYQPFQGLKRQKYVKHRVYSLREDIEMHKMVNRQLIKMRGVGNFKW